MHAQTLKVFVFGLHFWQVPNLIVSVAVGLLKLDLRNVIKIYPDTDCPL